MVDEGDLFFGLSQAQRRILLASEPDDRTGDEGCGIELRTGADYAAAKALKRKGLGEQTGPGGSLPGMYWNNELGLALRMQIMP